MLKALSTISIFGLALIVSVTQASELKQFKLKTCSPDARRCLIVDSANMAESSMGQIWVSDSAEVELSVDDRLSQWSAARVVIDMKRDQVVIEELKGKKLIESVISLSEFTMRRSEIEL